MMQLPQMNALPELPHPAADARAWKAERSQVITAMLLWVGMGAVYVISAFVWLHLLRHGYSARR